MRLIDADAMEKTMCDLVQGDIRHYSYSDTEWEMAFEWIDHQPTVDAVPVVRCGECKLNPKESWFGCPMAHLSERPENEWCSHGVRK